MRGKFIPSQNDPLRDLNSCHFSWLIRVGVGHLAGRRLLGVHDKKGFSHLIGALMDTTEQHHGAKLKQMVRQIVQKQNRSQLRLSSRPSNVAATAGAAAAGSNKRSLAGKSDVEDAG